MQVRNSAFYPGAELTQQKINVMRLLPEGEGKRLTEEFVEETKRKLRFYLANRRCKKPVAKFVIRNIVNDTKQKK